MIEPAAPPVRLWLAIVMVLGVVACSSGNKGGSKSGRGDPLVSQARTGTITPFGPRSRDVVTATYAPGGDASVAVYSSRITMPDGAIDATVGLSMQMIPSTVTQTPDLTLVSPLIQFSAKTEDGEAIERTDMLKSFRGEVVVDRFLDPATTVVIMILRYGTAEEERYLIVPDDLTYVEQEERSRLVTFETRDTDFAFAVAAARDGAPTNGFGRYLVVPGDSSNLAATSEGVDDVVKQAMLTWTPAEGSRSGYLLQIAYEPFTTSGCQAGTEIAAADITETRQKFPKVYVDAYTAKDLTDGATIYVQLCSINARSPPDASPGVSTTFSLSARAVATLTGAPSSSTNASALDVTVGGTGIVEYQYDLIPAGASCDAASYGAFTAVATKITDALSEGDYLLCVIGKRSAENVQIVPTSLAFTVDQTPPDAFTIDAVTTPTADSTPEIAWQAAPGAASYRVVIATNNFCDAVVATVTSTTTTASPPDLDDGTYYVCVTALDAAGNAIEATNDAQTFDVATGAWSATATASAPAARRGARAVFDDVSDTVIVWGGFDGTYLNSGGIYDADANTWGTVSTTGAPAARSQHTATWNGATMIVWGGFNSVTGELSTGGIYDPVGDLWTATSAASPPEARKGHSAVWDDANEAVIVWGGRGNDGLLNTGGMLDTDLNTWSATDDADEHVPSAREGHTAVWTGTYMVVWGGHDGTGAVASGGRFDPVGGDAWLAVATSGAPSARQGHTAVWTGTRMVIWGGHSGATYLNDGGIYDPVADTWTPIAADAAVAARKDHVAVWTGTRMLVWGGTTGAAYLATGGLLNPATGLWTVPHTDVEDAPSARDTAAGVWDPTNGKLVVVGGYGGGYLQSGGRFTPP